MTEKQYVQYKNDPNGTKWEVVPSEREEFWECKQQHRSSFYIRLPKSDYILCAPPERWEDVTAECKVARAISTTDTDRLSVVHQPTDMYWFDIFHPSHANKYRFVKRQLLPKEAVKPGQWAFIIEKREG